MDYDGQDPWASFRSEVRKLRSQSGFTQVRLGKATQMSSSLLSAIETGTRTPKRSHAEILDTAFSTGGRLTRLWLDINDSLDVPEWWRNISLLEREAIEISEYHMTLIPGLLQTPEYARTSMRLGRRWDPQSVIDRDVEARAARFSQLRDDVCLWFVVDEYALTRVVGSERVMSSQLDHILTAIEDNRVRFQVITQPAPHHPGMSGPVRILDFEDRNPVALVEHLMGEEVIQRADPVRKCRSLFGALQAEALSPTDSAKMIKTIREDVAT
ncbi:helix-turn-helix domain-containing protein [Streptomonospora sp. PA3]|uniref:helix-turn-helix domain-containing protein n=1 Tax=Streptomonospora sp. PA3 TaxID=2607326 RepID=UPI0012DF7B13|nr:Scr1 family TA system antitoxin-like transcriptional regulator [Streptomonospora sp. PA3]MUL42050.1 helix-turn-helix domain-containing protein [Streptomonospora sp. PA3]